MILNTGFRAGAIGRIAQMHGVYYEREWKLGRDFEARVAKGLGEFALRYDETTDLVLLAVRDDIIVASLVLDLNDPASADYFDGAYCAHLRFFILDDTTRGTGIGSRMLDQTVDYVNDRCAGRCWLTTFGGLDAARHMYEKRGFVLTREETGRRWGFELTDQVFERNGTSG